MLGKTHDAGSPEDQERGNVAQNAAEDGTSEHRSFKDKMKHPFPELRNKLKDTHLYDVKVGAIHLKHRLGKFENLVNSNHRHDEEHLSLIHI